MLCSVRNLMSAYSGYRELCPPLTQMTGYYVSLGVLVS
jgi:hypothetical protein